MINILFWKSRNSGTETTLLRSMIDHSHAHDKQNDVQNTSHLGYTCIDCKLTLKPIQCAVILTEVDCDDSKKVLKGSPKYTPKGTKYWSLWFIIKLSFSHSQNLAKNSIQKSGKSCSNAYAGLMDTSLTWNAQFVLTTRGEWSCETQEIHLESICLISYISCFNFR